MMYSILHDITITMIQSNITYMPSSRFDWFPPKYSYIIIAPLHVHIEMVVSFQHCTNLL